MTILQAIILGLVQGLTEFLPVSSSAHLVFVPYLLSWNIDHNQMFVFNVLVQMGTLFAVMIYFRKDIWVIIHDFFKGIFTGKPFSTQESRLGWYLILATIPAGLLGLLFKEEVEKAFASPSFAAVFLIVTAALLVIGEKISTRRRTLRSFSWPDALVMGAFQALSIFPGISRSGATISGGLLRKLDRPSSARFSFLMSIPIMLAAGLLGIIDLFEIPNPSLFLPKMIIGFLFAGIVGYFVIHFFMRLISRSSLLGFALYCALIGITMLILSLFIYPSPGSTDTQSPTTMQTISIELPPSLHALSDSLGYCANQGKDINLRYVEDSSSSEIDGELLSISLGESGDTLNSYQIGTEDIVVIVNPENVTSSISNADLTQIYMGTIVKWHDTDIPIEVYTYPSETDIQRLFLSSVMNNAPITTLSHLVFTPAEMLTAIAADPSGIGVVPARFLNNSVSVLSVDSRAAVVTDVPILAASSRELSEELRVWIVCLQDLP